MLLNHIYKEMSLFGACQHQRYETQRIGRCKGRLHALQKACLESPRFQQRNTSCSVQLVQTLLKQFLILSNRLTLLHRKKQLLNAGEGPPTLQSTVIPARNYAPQLLGKVTPTFSPIVSAARKSKSTKKKKLSSQICKTP